MNMQISLARGNATKGVVRISVANVLKSPRHESTLMTQALMGTAVTILKEKAGWFFVRLSDSYIGWVHKAITPMTSREYREWDRREKIIITDLQTNAFANDRRLTVVSDLVAGDVLALVNESARFYQVMYPDSRTGFCLKKSAQPLKAWSAQAHATPASIVETAKRFTGVPYLWGGTSSKALDCSGFVKYVYFLNGVELPRDAEQQALAGREIAPGAKHSNVKPGDILYFAVRSRVTHVGLSLGGKRFMEASGDVHVSSLDPDDPEFEKKRAATFLGVRRIIKTKKAVHRKERRDFALFATLR